MPQDREITHRAIDHETPEATTAGQSGGNPDAVELALAEALTRATAAGAWDVVGQLARELEARRKARAQIVDLATERVRRGG